MLLPPADNVFKQSGIPSGEVRLKGRLYVCTCLFLNDLIFCSHFGKPAVLKCSRLADSYCRDRAFASMAVFARLIAYNLIILQILCV